MPSTMLIFDIETHHDKHLMQTFGYQAKDGAFPPLIFHLPCAIAVGYLTGDGLLTGVESLLDDPMGIPAAPWDLTEAFWTMANHTSVLVTFNGRSFDIPVLELCALRYGCTAPKHWQNARGTRYRYGNAHLDMLDILSNYGMATKGLSLTNVVQLLEYAGKDDMDGSRVQEMWEAGNINEIQAYNRLDVIRTYAVWLHWARMAGRLTEDLYQAALIGSKQFLDLIR
jgi:3'-5' exonuclease